MIGDDLGWEYPPELEPDPAGETEQPVLFLDVEVPFPEPEWKLSWRTRQIGLAGVRRAKEALNRADR